LSAKIPTIVSLLSLAVSNSITYYIPACPKPKPKKNLNTKRKCKPFPNGLWQVFVIDLHRVVVVPVLHYDVLDLVIRILLTVIIIILIEIRIRVKIDNAKLPLSFGYYRR
jgi:hypothetical protein